MKNSAESGHAGAIPSEWRCSTLGHEVDFLDGMRRPVKDSDRKKMHGTIPYYGASGIVDYVNDYIFDEELVLLGEDGENIISRNLPLAFRIEGKSWVNNHAHVMRASRRINSTFLAALLESYDFVKYNSGTAQPKLNKQSCLNIPLVVPPIREQEAIAQALRDSDDLMASIDALIAKKRDIKQAAMQQLLTGKTRLPGFDDKWVSIHFSKFAPLQRGFDLPTKHLRSGPHPVAYSNGVLAHHNQFMVKGPGVVTGRSGTIGNITYLEDNFWPHNTALWVTSFDHSDPKFVYYHLQHMNLARFATGSGVPTLNRNDVHAQIVKIPEAKAEQAAIADALSDLDAEIAMLMAKLEKVRMLREGMMQQLLTGRIRLV